jgi:hypothetical protein
LEAARDRQAAPNLSLISVGEIIHPVPRTRQDRAEAALGMISIFHPIICSDDQPHLPTARKHRLSLENLTGLPLPAQTTRISRSSNP